MSGPDDMGLGAYPRPQLVRDAWTDLNGLWEFSYDDNDEGERERWYRPGSPTFAREILVPFPPESSASGVGDTGPHSVVWYRRGFVAPEVGTSQRVILHFGAVDYRANVWVNGEHVGYHEGGHTPFVCDVTLALRGTGGESVIVVRAEDRPEDLSQPRGKQSWTEKPQRIWYGRTSGIWQAVWLEVVPDLYISSLHWGPDVANGTVGVDVKLSRPPNGRLTVRVTIKAGEHVLADVAADLRDEEGRMSLALVAAPGRHALDGWLWSPESPVLLDAVVALSEDGTPGDVVRSYFGMRSVQATDGLFILNGRPLYLRLALEQGFWPESHLAAPSAAALRREVELIKALGLNGVRIHQKVEDPRFLYWADRLGVLVWSEMPSTYVYSRTTVRRLVTEWMEVLERDRSHPSIVAWVPFNESWGVDDIQARADQQHFVLSLYHLTKAIDPTRPVISNDGWEHVTSDIWTVHDYEGRGAAVRERYAGPERLRRSLEGRPAVRRVLLKGYEEYSGQPVVLSECGGFSYMPAAGEEWFGYTTVKSATEYLARVRELIEAVCDNEGFAGFCYTQLTDTAQERNGLLDEHRAPKLDIDELRKVFRRVSKAVPAEREDVVTGIEGAARA